MTFKEEEVKKRTRLHLRKNQSRSYQKVASLSTSGTATWSILTRGIKLVKKRLTPRVWWETKEAVKQKFLELNGTRKATH